MKLCEDEIHIYRSTLEKPPAEVKQLEKILSPDEIEKAYKFKFETDRNNYIVGRAFLRNILNKYLEIDASKINFSYAEKGKPFIKDSIVKFNLAHSKSYVVYAFTLEKEVGIDLEYLKEMPDAREIAKGFFSKDETHELDKVSEKNLELAFFNCWTRKEAFIKAVGEGLSYPLADFTVTLIPGDEPEIIWIKKNPEEINDWSMINIEVKENYISSLAIKSKGVRIIYKEMKDNH
jgi:4'-phosphopantetheinyl transferase